MKILRSLVLAFAMYSRIPMPRTKWEDDNMALAFCFFPLVGVVIGAALWLWLWLCCALGIGALLRAAGAVLIPAALTGGIHMDGFCDTLDALSSHQDREKKLEILKDSHAGAFAIFWCALYLICFTALWSDAELTGGSMLVLAAIPVLSRSLSGTAAVSFKNARGSGMLATFSGAVNIGVVRLVCIAWGVLAALVAILSSPVLGLAVTLAAALSFVYYRIKSFREFGGITGDLEGWFLQICEIACVFAVVAVQKIGGIL